MVFLIFIGCGPDDGNFGVTYSFKITNNTGNLVVISTGSSSQIDEGSGISQSLLNGESYECSVTAGTSFGGALCDASIEILMGGNSNLGYRCYAFVDQQQGLCFVNDEEVYQNVNPSIFTETNSREFEYVLQPGFFDNAYTLP